jgi:immunity protein, SdpI family
LSFQQRQLPLAAAAIYVLLLLVPRIDPRRAHYAKFQRPFLALRTATVTFFFAVDLLVLAWVRGHQVNVNTFVPIASGLLMVVLGNYLPKIQSNWFVGVRTPWTLSSESSWRRTHRLAGWLFLASGVASVLATLIRPETGIAVLGATVTMATLMSVIYSYVAWRHDPSRVVGGA